MRATKFPLRCALLATALMQVYPQLAAAKGDDEHLICEDCPDTSGKSGWVEGGIAAQSDDAYRLGRYTGYDESGGQLNFSGEYRYRARDNGGYVDVRADDLGLASREMAVLAGRQGRYDLALEYDQIPNYREADTLSPFRHQGDGVLGLPAGWVPGSSTTTMPTLGADLMRTPLHTERDRLGVRFAFIPGRQWEIAGHFRREEKEGVKDQGATMYFNQSAILPVPVSSQTDDFGLALGYAGERLQARMAYDGSVYRNDFNRIAWDNPFAAVPAVASGQMADAPDNEFHQLSAVLGYQLSESTRIGAKFAQGRMTQDDALLPYTVNPALAGTALPRSRLDGEIDTTLARVEINARPADKLRVDASYTYSDRDNNTSVDTYDYVVTDALSGGLRQNRPYSFEQKLLRAKVGYRIGESDLSAGFDHDRMSRTYQQVEETTDKTLWARLKMHPAETVDATFKLSHASRDATPYTPQANEHSLMRIHNLAERDRDKAGIEVTYTPDERLSLGLDLEYLTDDYSHTALGLREASGMTSNINVTYAFSERLTATAYYNHERLTSDQAGSAWIAVPAVDSPWIASDKNLTQTFGMAFNWVAIAKKLDLGVDLVYADYSGDIRFAGATDLPNLGATLTGVGVHGVYKLKDNLSLRAGYRYERYKESDWSKTGNVDAVSSLLGLGAAPQDYDTHLVTLALRYEFK